jgi:hypothetical protein
VFILFHAIAGQCFFIDGDAEAWRGRQRDAAVHHRQFDAA